MGAPLILQGGLGVLGTALELQDNQVAGMQEQINAEANKKMALEAAADAVVRGNVEASRVRTAATQTIARQRVGFAASGVDGSVGTAAQVAAGTRAIAETDARILENNAAREAWGFKQAGDQIHRQGVYDRMRRQNQQTGTILTGAARAGNVYASSIKK